MGIVLKWLYGSESCTGPSVNFPNFGNVSCGNPEFEEQVISMVASEAKLERVADALMLGPEASVVPRDSLAPNLSPTRASESLRVSCHTSQRPLYLVVYKPWCFWNPQFLGP